MLLLPSFSSHTSSSGAEIGITICVENCDPDDPNAKVVGDGKRRFLIFDGAIFGTVALTTPPSVALGGSLAMIGASPGTRSQYTSSYKAPRPIC